MAVTTLTTVLPHLVGKFYDRLLLDNLYPDLYFYAFGEKRKLPANSGKTIFFNRWVKLSAAAAVTEGTVITTSGMSATFVSATVAGYAIAARHSDFVVMGAISDVVAGAVQEVSKSLALAIDNQCRLQLSTGGTGVFASGTASGSLQAANRLTAKDVLRTLRTMNTNNVKTFPDGFYGGILHPYQIWDVQSDTATGGWIDVNKYASNDTVQNLYRGEVGQIYGIRVVRSSNVKALTGVGGMSAAGTSGECGFQGQIVGPGAYGVVELDEGSARVFVKQLGSGGTSDPANQLATIAAKVYFAVAKLDNNRRVRLVSGKSPAI